MTAPRTVPAEGHERIDEIVAAGDAREHPLHHGIPFSVWRIVHGVSPKTSICILSAQKKGGCVQLPRDAPLCTAFTLCHKKWMIDE
jgi:hypothetical protein